MNIKYNKFMHLPISVSSQKTTDMNQLSPECESVLIAGNGPSLAAIDYDYLPEKFDVFRCNQFYMEDAYFVGRKVKWAFFHHGLFFEQYATIDHLEKQHEYEYEGVALSDLHTVFTCQQKVQDIFQLFPNTLNVYALCQNKLPEIMRLVQRLALFENKVLTSGVIMALTSVALGYRKLYFAGLDLYQSNQTYAFDTKRKNLLSIYPSFQDLAKANSNSWHSAETDLMVLRALRELYDVEMYSVSPSSPLTEHFPLPLATGFGEYNKQRCYAPKNECACQDVVIPSSSFYHYYRERHNVGQYKIDPVKLLLKSNLWYRILYDAIRFPRLFWKYLRQKWQKRAGV